MLQVSKFFLVADLKTGKILANVTVAENEGWCDVIACNVDVLYVQSSAFDGL